MNNHEAIYKLLNVKGLGPRGINMIFTSMRKHDLKPQDIFTLSVDDFYTYFPFIGKGRYASVQPQNFLTAFDESEKRMKVMSQQDIYLISSLDPDYPPILKERLQENCPPVLFLKGNLALLKKSSIAIIGSRRGEDEDIEKTKNIAGFLAKKGYNIISGYAKGVDTAAHVGALDKGGTTTIVLSMGISQFHLKKDFYQYDYKKNALFLSQFLPTQAWKAHHAMQRNKTICALSQAVIVIVSGPEKDAKGRMSGTFNAAKFALQQGIPLFVLRPECLRTGLTGNQELIAKGAKPFEKAEDILAGLQSLSISEGKSKQLSLFPVK